MQTKDPTAIARMVESLARKQNRAVELREELDRSLALDALFPGIFEGPGKVTSRIVGNLRFRPLHAVFRVTRADGKESELPLLRVPVELWGPTAFNDFIEGQHPRQSTYGVRQPGCYQKVNPITLAEFRKRGFA